MTEAEAALAAMQGPDLDVRSLSTEGARKDGSKELFDQVRERIVRRGGLYFMCKSIIGYVDMTRRAHLAVSCFYEDDTIHSKLCEFPKSHFKSSIGTCGKSLHRIAKRCILRQDISDRIALGSNTKTNSKRFLRLIKQVVESSVLFQTFVPEAIPEFSNEDVWNQDELIFPRVGSYTDPTIDTLGVGGAATSRHYTMIIEDDMLSEEDVDSPTAVRKSIELHQYYSSLLVPGNPVEPGDHTMHHIVNEHCWMQHDLNNHIVTKEPATVVFSVGASKGLNEHRSRLVPDYILELTKPWRDGRPVFVEKYDEAELLRRREKAGARTYNAVYENDPFDPETVDFKESDLRYFEWDSQGRGLRIPVQPGVTVPELVPFAELRKVSAFDPAISRRTDAARSALVVHGVDAKSRVFQLAAKAWREEPLTVLNLVFAEVNQWRPDSCAVEDVLFQKVLLDLLNDRCKVWNQRNPATPIYPGVFKGVKPPRGATKEGRLRAHIGASTAAHRVYVHRSQVEFIDEYLHFPLGSTVDLLDAFTYAAMLWTPGVSVEQSAIALAAEARWLAQRDAITGY